MYNHLLNNNPTQSGNLESSLPSLDNYNNGSIAGAKDNNNNNSTISSSGSNTTTLQNYQQQLQLYYTTQINPNMNHIEVPQYSAKNITFSN
eukprot:UN06799